MLRIDQLLGFLQLSLLQELGEAEDDLKHVDFSFKLQVALVILLDVGHTGFGSLIRDLLVFWVGLDPLDLRLLTVLSQHFAGKGRGSPIIVRKNIRRLELRE